MGQLQQLRVVDAVLTELARGYSNSQLVAETLFPIATMAKEGGKIPKFGKEAFKQYATERAIRGNSNRINPDARTTVDVVLTEHDLEYPVDYREEAEDVFPAEQNAVMVVTEGIKLRLEKMCADLAQTTTNYASGNTITLSGNSQFTNKNSDPIGVVEDGKAAIRGKIGQQPNTMLIGAAAFKALKNHTQLLERIKYSMTGVATVELMKQIFGIANIVVGEAIYANDAGTVLSDVWGDNIILAWVPTASAPGQRTYYRPSFGYTLRKSGYPSVDKYTEFGGKLSLVRCTDLFAPKIVGSDAGYLIYDTNAATSQNP